MWLASDKKKCIDLEEFSIERRKTKYQGNQTDSKGLKNPVIQ